MSDPLLDELNGTVPDGMPPMIDPAAPAAPNRDAELTVKDAPRATPSQAADLAHATHRGGAGFRVDIKGEYYANSEDRRGKVRKPFSLSVNVAKIEGCASVIKNRLLLPALKRAYPDAIRHRTFRIVAANPLNAATPKSQNLAYMDREQLEQYAKAAQPAIAGLDLSTYSKDAEGTLALREALIDYVQNPHGFAKREAERRVKRAEEAELAALNPELSVGG